MALTVPIFQVSPFLVRNPAWLTFLTTAFQGKFYLCRNSTMSRAALRSRRSSTSRPLTSRFPSGTFWRRRKRDFDVGTAERASSNGQTARYGGCWLKGTSLILNDATIRPSRGCIQARCAFFSDAGRQVLSLARSSLGIDGKWTLMRPSSSLTSTPLISNAIASRASAVTVHARRA